MANYTDEDIEQVVSAYKNGKSLLELDDVGDVDPSELYTEVVDSTGVSKKTTLANLIAYDEDEVAYGVRRNVSDSSPDCTRIGSMELHRTCPVQTRLRGCLLGADGKVSQYLPEKDWTGATLDGSKGHVMVEIPEHYRKCQLLDDGTMEIWLSLYHLKGYETVPKMYISAYEATVQRSTNTLSSVMNTDADYRGGNNTSSYDGTYRSMLGMPATSITAINFLNYARNNGSNSWCSDLYVAQRALAWCFVVEYATLNSQKAYNAELTEEGFHQGGLGNGVTTLSQNRWYNSFGNYWPFIPIGYTNEFGNGTGLKDFTMPFEYDGASSTSGDTGTRYVGEHDATTSYSQGDYVSDGEDLYQCIADAPAGTSVENTSYFSPVTRTVVSVNRYHGIEQLFGHIYKWCCDILVVAHPSEESGGEGDGLNYVYVCNDPEQFYLSALTDAYIFIGTTDGRAAGGGWLYFKQVLFGRYGEIFGKDSGGSSSTYFCDGHYANNNVTVETLRGVLFGGYASAGASAGTFCVSSHNAPSNSNADYGSRLCFYPAAA